MVLASMAQMAPLISEPQAGNFGTNDFTVEFWLKTTSQQQQALLFKREAVLSEPLEHPHDPKRRDSGRILPGL